MKTLSFLMFPALSSFLSNQCAFSSFLQASNSPNADTAHLTDSGCPVANALLELRWKAGDMP